MSGLLRLDLANASGPDGALSLEGSLPAELQTQAALYAMAYAVPIIADPSIEAVRGRIRVRLAALRGKVRIGILKPGGRDYGDQREIDESETADIELRLAGSGELGALVWQNLAPTASRFRLLSLEILEETPYPEERSAAVGNYLRSGFNGISGWCSYLNVEFLRRMDRELFTHWVDGSVGEIGVHHGRQFIALHHLKSAGAKSLAIDVFDDQQFNIDGSGSGDRRKFTNNLAALVPDPLNCVIVGRDSLSLTDREVAELGAQVGPLKFFSIDGCHEPEHTLADLRIAMRLLAHGGIIILDDYYNPDYPGVHQAAAYLFLHDRPGIAPFLTGENKVYLTHVSHHARYYRAAKAIIDGFAETSGVQPVKLYGYAAHSWRSAVPSWDFPVQTP